MDHLDCLEPMYERECPWCSVKLSFFGDSLESFWRDWHDPKFDMENWVFNCCACNKPYIFVIDGDTTDWVFDLMRVGDIIIPVVVDGAPLWII